jgi:stress response protein YsnF
MSTPHPQPEHGMVVMTPDGLLGTADTTVLVDSQTSLRDELLIVRREDGALVSVPRSAIEQITDATIYLSVPRDTLPIMQPPDDMTVREQRGVATDGDHLEIPLLEEQLQVGTHTVELGRVQVRKRVEEQIAQHVVGLRSEELEVERLDVDRIVDEMPEPFMDGDVLVVPVVEEELVEVVVRRQLRVKQELRIRRVAREIEHTIDVPLRSEQVEITRTRNDEDVSTSQTPREM